MRALGISILISAAPIAGSVIGQTTAVLDSSQVRRWREDLEWLSREAPARHANLFHTMRREQFDSAIGSLTARLPRLARHQVIVELQRLAALIGDGHSNVGPWRDTVIAFHTLPIALYRFDEGYYVRAATREHAGLLGARVLRIGDVSADSAEALVAPLISRDNAMGIWMFAPLFVQMPEILHALGIVRDPGGRVPITLEVNGARRVVDLEPAGLFPNLSGDIDRSWVIRPGWVDLRERAPAPAWMSATEQTYWFRYIAEMKALYCQINTIQERQGDPLPEFLARAIHAADSAGADKFVLDLRLNAGGNGYYNRAIMRALIRSRYDEPGRLFIITGRRTFSAAQMLITELENWANPTFVGEPSASRGIQYGDSRRLVLPNNRVTFRVSSLYWQLSDPRDDRPWIVPTIAAPLTVAAYAAGRDPALEAIAAYRPEPALEERLRPLAATGDTSGAWQALQQFRSDPKNRWQDVNRILSDLQETLVAEGKAKDGELVSELAKKQSSVISR